MTNPRVSVVMPVFNGEQYLDDAIRSIRNQSFRDFELIVVNDGSTDGTQSILDLHAREDSRLKVLSRENKGLVTSLNEGIDIAIGSLIARMDADDISLPDRLREQVDFLDQNTSISIVGGQALLIDEKSNSAGVLHKPTTKETIEAYLNFGCPIIHPTYLVRRDVFAELQGYREIMAAEDLDLLLRAASHGFRMANLSDVILKYRVTTSGMSSRNARRQMRSTRLMLSNYRKSVLPKEIEWGIALSESNHVSAKTGSWFNFIWNVRTTVLTGNRGAQKLPAIFLAGALSMLHYELFFSAYRIWRCKRLLKKSYNK